MCDNINQNKEIQIRDDLVRKAKNKDKKQNAANKLTMDYVLSQIEKIALQTEYLNNAISELRQMEIVGSGDIGSANKAEAIGDIVKCRETTNQQLLKLYEKMYDDLKPTPSLKEKVLDVANKTLNNPSCGEVEKEQLSEVLDTLKHLEEPHESSNLKSRFIEITDWAKSLNRDEFDPVTWEAITESIKAQLSRNW